MRNLLYLKETIKLFFYKGQNNAEFKHNVYCAMTYYIAYENSLIFLRVENQAIFMSKFA